MTYRRLAWALGAMVAATVIPATAHGAPPTKCLTNTPKGKQVYVPCDLLNAGANFPPGQRCPPPIEQYPKDVAEWCGEGRGLATTTPASPTSPTNSTSQTSPTSATSTTSTTSATTPTSPTSPTTPTSPTSPTTPTTPTTPSAPGHPR
ncbi:hypothetical protein HMPREF0591_4317 [Mycobacterium parascrofulaceum ATCC BAA-614]|uniref:Uncharacterized protein n=1 Tax=Mycobacterium parascrofulaceum ATCC BAA-614 TaxID=525368 RepID=D5PDS3_9MYCO|nr:MULTISPECIES: hypothetical protein [Mycobacterium]EFG75788.1 hypothetical protein HMPREF0591_4317 [Mycobacterium parascrofulaceum ATCC BAA-614]